MSAEFLSRWSRRKLGARADRPETPPLQTEPLPLAQDGGTRLHDGTPAPFPSAADPAPSDAIAALPKPEELTSSSDITGFLRSGVPAALRNAALRRMWVLDPAIRDAVGDARDYAWDWNVPGGVPVSGPLPETADVARMVREVMGDGRPAETPPTVSGVREPDLRVRSSEAAGPDRDPPPAGGATAPPVSEPDAGPPGEAGQGADGPDRSGAAEPPAVAAPARPRRHGSALPS